MRLRYQFLSVLDALQVLLLPLFGLVLLLQVRLDGLVLRVEVAHVLRRQTVFTQTHRRTKTRRLLSDTHRHQVFDHVHVRQRIDLRHLAGVSVDFVQTRQRVSAVDIHRTRPADPCGQNRLRPETTSEPVHTQVDRALTLSAGASEGQRAVHLVLDLDERVQNHRPAAETQHTPFRATSRD